MTSNQPPQHTDAQGANNGSRSEPTEPTRPRIGWRGPAWALGIGLAAAILLLPFDVTIGRAISGWWSGSAGGDIRREFEALQQFGAVGSLLIAAGCVALVDGRRVRRLLDWIAAYLLVGLAVHLMKRLIGRPRPRVAIGDEAPLLGPFGAYPLPADSEGVPRGVHYAWESWADISSDLWAFPSAHTASAAALAVMLAVMYPRLWPIGMVMTLLVGFTRVATGAHWPADIAMGAGVGVAVAVIAMRGYLGVRAIDALWRLFDRNASPALPDVINREAKADTARRASLL